MMRPILLAFAALAVASCSPAPVSHDTLRAATTLVVREDGHGSGVVVGKRLVMTAAHVTEGVETVSVRFVNGERMDARIVWAGVVKQLDVAMLALPRDAPVDAVKLSCDPLEPDQTVRAFGAPQNAPVISSLLRIASGKIWPGSSTSTAIAQGPLIAGMSGGPVFNERGEIAGFVHSQYREPVGGGFNMVWVPNGLSGIVPAADVCAALPGVA